MNLLIRGVLVAATAAVVLTGVSAKELVKAVSPFQTAQRGNPQSSRVLQVALPELATVRMNQGGSYTGELTRFSANSLTLSASGQSLTLSHGQIRQVEFGGTVWIPNPNGDIEAYRIRGLSQSLVDVPVNALVWDGSSSLANLNLQGVLTQGEFNNLTRNPSLIYALVGVNFETSSSTMMNVTVKALARSQ